jgi:hypothetical protein
MSDFKPGEIVDVVIKGVRVDEQGPNGCVSIVAEAPNGLCGHWLMPPQAAITRVAPAEWPPQPGDLWRDASGCLLFTRDLFEGDVSMAPAAGTLDEETPARAWEIFGPLTLVHREETTPEPFDSTYGGQPT